MFARPGWLSSLLALFLVPLPFSAAESASVCHDRDGDALPAGALDRLGTVRFRQGGPVNAVAFSPSGDMLASGGEDGSIYLWRVPDGKLLRKLQNTGLLTWVNFLAFSRDGKRLVSLTKTLGRLRFWEPASGRLLRTLDLNGAGEMESFALAPDGKTVAAGFDRGRVLAYWDAATGKKLRQAPKTIELSCSLAISADGKVLISGDGDRNVRVWDDAEPRQFDDHPSLYPCYSPCVITLSPNGKTFAHAIGDDLRVRDVKTGDCRYTLRGPEGKILALAFSADGTMLASGCGRHSREGRPSIHWWDVRSGRLRHTVTDLEGDVRSVAFSPDGKRLASASDDTSILIWDMTRSPNEDANTPLAHGELETLWHHLGERDAKMAYRTVLRLAAHPTEAVPFLRKHFVSLAPAERRRIQRCIAELDDEHFAVRQRAQCDLGKFVAWAEPALRQALTRRPTLEVRHRIESILACCPPLYDENAPPNRLRELRAVEVLERIGSAETRQFLTALATGDFPARLMREARAARERLDQQAARKRP